MIIWNNETQEHKIEGTFPEILNEVCNIIEQIQTIVDTKSEMNLSMPVAELIAQAMHDYQNINTQGIK